MAVMKQANIEPSTPHSEMIKIFHTFTLDPRHGQDPELEPLHRKALALGRGLSRFMGARYHPSSRGREIPPGTDEEGYIDVE